MVEIYEYNGEGYDKTMNYGEWRVAFLNYAERFDIEKMTKLERHTLTDEVFVLLFGEAQLVLEQKLVPMEKGKIYNVPKNVWHGISVSKDAKVLIVENHNTSADNTEFKPFVKF